MSRYNLKSFEGDAESQALRLAVTCESLARIMKITFELTGKIDSIVLPPQGLTSEFRDHLWQKTCFELFLSSVGRDSYLEWNFSSEGHWACYSFANYRKPAEPFKIFSAPNLLRAEHRDGRFRFEVELMLPHGLSEANLEMGLAAVLEHKSKRLSHWAVAHPVEKPDFHLRSGFQSRLSSTTR